MITVLLLLSDPSKIVVEYPISDDRRAYVIATPDADSPGLFSINVRFSTVKNGVELRRVDYGCRVSVGFPHAVVVGDFVNSGRNQIYIATHHAEWNTWVLDFDGTRISTIYKNVGHRIWTNLNRDEKGRYYVLETDPRNNLKTSKVFLNRT